VASLPRLPFVGEVTTESNSIAGELTADVVSAAIDRRDVPRRETPLHLKLCDNVEDLGKTIHLF
jgi:hypothetical protein